MNSTGRVWSRRDRALAVERIAQRIDDAADDGVADRHFEQRAERADLVAFGDLEVIAEDDDADRVFFEVEDEPADLGAGELDHFAVHGAGEAVDAGDAVADFEHAAHLARVELVLVGLDFTLQN